MAFPGISWRSWARSVRSSSRAVTAMPRPLWGSGDALRRTCAPGLERARNARNRGQSAGSLETGLDFEPGHLVVFLPAFGAWLAHAPVLSFKLFEGLAAPLDGGLTFRGARVFGDNKTWRGALTMFAGTLVSTLLLWRLAWYKELLPSELLVRGAWAHGSLLGLAVV